MTRDADFVSHSGGETAAQSAETVLVERLQNAARQIDQLATTHHETSPEYKRLRGKAEGVRLAISYVEDRKRELLQGAQDDGPEEV